MKKNISGRIAFAVVLLSVVLLTGCATSGSPYLDVPLEQSATLIVQGNIFLTAIDDEDIGSWGAVFFNFTMIIPAGKHVIEWNNVFTPQKPVTAVFEAGREYYFDGKITDRGTQAIKTAGAKEKAPASGRAAANMAEALQSIPEPALQNFYFNGDGGKGKRLAILIPEGKNLSAAEAYLPTLVQGVFVTDLSKYSAISVLDRQNLEKVLKEAESGIYKSEADFVQLGEIANVGYALTGSLTKTTSGFAMQIQIADTANGLTKASYTGSCTARELENFTGIRKASLDLLTQMGIELTAKGREELTGSGAQQSINAETALAKGITAQRSGTVVEALNYYYNATSADPSQIEAASRLSVLQTSVKTGNFREDARNEIQQRNAWLALLKECEDFYSVETRKYPAEIVYDPAIYPVSQINFQTETQDFATGVELRPTQEAQNMLKVVQNLRNGLDALGEQKLNAWSSNTIDLTRWPFPARAAEPEQSGLSKPLFFANDYYSGNRASNVIGIQASLINENGKVLGTNCVILNYNITYEPPKVLVHELGRSEIGSKWVIVSFSGSGSLASFIFSNVPVNDITDRVTVRITHVAIDNGAILRSWGQPKILSQLPSRFWKVIDAETAGKTGLIQISAGTVRNPNNTRSYERIVTADSDTVK